METEYKKKLHDRIKIQEEKLGMLPQMEFAKNSGLYKTQDFRKDKIFFNYNKDETFDAAKKKIEDLCGAGATEDRVFLDYSEASLCIPPTSKGLVCRNEQWTIICVMVPRSMLLQHLSQKNAINQAVLFKHLIKTLPNQPHGKKTHISISKEKYMVAGVTALQGNGLSTHKVGVIPDHQRRKRELGNTAQSYKDKKSRQLKKKKLKKKTP
jgi:hypothetical protein